MKCAISEGENTVSTCIASSGFGASLRDLLIIRITLTQERCVMVPSLFVRKLRCAMWFLFGNRLDKGAIATTCDALNTLLLMGAVDIGYDQRCHGTPLASCMTRS
jgi:hypothetical protein